MNKLKKMKAKCARNKHDFKKQQFEHFSIDVSIFVFVLHACEI
jgi:hypothetical protein